MSTIGSPIETSLVQTAQAQLSASKARDKEKAASDSARRFADMVELRVAGVEDSEAIRKLPSNDSEQAADEHQAKDLPGSRPNDDDEDEARPRIDVKA